MIDERRVSVWLLIFGSLDEAGDTSKVNCSVRLNFGIEDVSIAEKPESTNVSPLRIQSLREQMTVLFNDLRASRPE